MSQDALGAMIDDFVDTFDTAKEVLASGLEGIGKNLEERKSFIVAATNSVVGGLISFRIAGKPAKELGAHLARAIPSNLAAILGGQQATERLANRLNEKLGRKLTQFERDELTWAIANTANFAANLDRVSSKQGLQNFANSAVVMNPISMLPGYGVDLLVVAFKNASQLVRR